MKTKKNNFCLEENQNLYNSDKKEQRKAKNKAKENIKNFAQEENEKRKKPKKTIKKEKNILQLNRIPFFYVSNEEKLILLQKANKKAIFVNSDEKGTEEMIDVEN